MKNISHYFQFANFVTTLNLIVGLTSIFLALQHQLNIAIILWLLTPIGDSLDGMIARMTPRDNSQQIFGFQLDSLSDLTNFAIVPGILLFMSGINEWYEICLLIFLACAVLWRLAYFAACNAQHSDSTIYYGLPSTYIPLLLAPVFATAYFNPLFYKYTAYIVLFLIMILMLSKIKVTNPSLKINILLLVYLFLMMALFYFVPITYIEPNL
ncbi:MAG: Phosphatidylserine synthase [uncultured bacterium]|nr:MAG: Phosphatidylserine synthase [uncultured bacterium]